MQKLFESKFMISLQDFGQKLGSNNFLAALQGAMMSTMGIIMVGAVFQIITAVGPMFGLFENGGAIYNILYMPYNYTMNLLSLWIVILMAFNYAKKLKMKSPVINAIDATVCFLVATSAFMTTTEGLTALNMSFLGASGMFTGFLIVFVVIQVEKFCADKNIRIKMPDVCPPFLVDGFSSIIPLLLNVIIFTVISTVIGSVSGGMLNLASGIMALLAYPLSVLVSVPGMFIIGTFAMVLWCFGIHGTMIVYPVLMPMMFQATTTNAANAAAGQPLVFFPVALFAALGMCGGAGNTLPLALFGTRSKSKQIRAVCSISTVPGWFGINEPMTFGMPIMYNPILCIPFVLTIPVVMLCILIGYEVGFLQPGFIPIMGLMPMGFGAYLSTLRWQNAIFDYLMLIPTGLVWFPFFKVYERQLVAKEKEAEALEAAEAAAAK